MNRVMISAFAICLAAAASTALSAQENRHDQGGQSAQHATPPTAPTGGLQGQTHRVGTIQDHGATSHTTTTHTTSRYHGTPAGVNPSSRYHRTTTGTATNERVMERSHVRVDIATYHRNVTAERRFHYGDYRAPRGYEYRRWTYGERLPAIYFGRDYWIPNYINFGLAYAPDGYVWVRYGSDAILIDEYTGEIVEVVYNVFY